MIKKNCIDNHANINEATSSLMAMETILVFGLENAIWATPRLSSAILIFMLTPSYEDTCSTTTNMILLYRFIDHVEMT